MDFFEKFAREHGLRLLQPLGGKPETIWLAQTAEGEAWATAANVRPATAAERVQPQQAPAAAAETSFAPVENRETSAPPSIEQSAADSESFMALLRRADAAFQRISRRNDPMPGADMLPGGAAVPSTRRSSRHGDAPRESPMHRTRPSSCTTTACTRASAPRTAMRPPAGPSVTPVAVSTATLPASGARRRTSA